jgi:excisionase family DNA binding protein
MSETGTKRLSAIVDHSTAPEAQCSTLQPGSKEEPFVDANEAARFLALTRRRVLELARKGQIPAYPIGTGARMIWRFRLSELASSLQARLHCARQSPAPDQETI